MARHARATGLAALLAALGEALQSEMTTGSGDREPVHVQLPVLRAENAVADKTWTAYHVNVRGLKGPYAPDGFQVQTEAFALPDDLPPAGSASSTFQGVPADMTANEVLGIFEVQDPLDESQLQLSVLNLIGDGIEGAYYGEPERPAAHVHADGDDVRPQLHAATRTLRPVMVADSTVYDPDTGSWLVSHWFDRVDADFADNNRILVRTEVGGYLVLTEYGADQIDWTSFVFMHESGHIIGGDTIKNLTKVADCLHGNLD